MRNSVLTFALMCVITVCFGCAAFGLVSYVINELEAEAMTKVSIYTNDLGVQYVSGDALVKESLATVKSSDRLTNKQIREAILKQSGQSVGRSQDVYSERTGLAIYEITDEIAQQFGTLIKSVDFMKDTE